MNRFKIPIDLEARPSVQAAKAYLALVKSFADRLASMRRKAGISVADMSAILGVGRADLLQLESGNPEHAPSLIQVSAYSIVCGIPVKLADASTTRTDVQPRITVTKSRLNTAPAKPSSMVTRAFSQIYATKDISDKN